MIHRPVEQGHPVFGARFGEDVAHVVIHRALADRERFCDFLVGESLGDQLNDLQLPFREIAFRACARARTHTLFPSPDHHGLTLE